MKREQQKYKLIILVLFLLVILEGIFIVTTRPKKITKVPIKVALKGKIAIVLDDWGYNLNNLEITQQIKYPLTISVLPNLSYSRQVAEVLYHRGFEIILHLPLEPIEKTRLEKNTILTSMNEEKIKEIIGQDLASVPFAKGVSNHMGSKASSDSKTMTVIFGELKKRKLYFLDSLVTYRSIGSNLAHKKQLGFAKRDIFLDNQEDPVYIKKQISKLKAKARACGWAIGIGHNRKITLDVLGELMPVLEKEGYKFVFVSELIS